MKPANPEPPDDPFRNVPAEEMLKWIKYIESAEQPSVAYNGDQSVMREEAYQYRGAVLGLLLENLKALYWTGELPQEPR